MSPDPKAELHVHLEGSIGPATLRKINPNLSGEEIARGLACNSFASFLEAYKWVVGELRTPEHYAMAARDLIAALAAEGVRYAEITLSAGVVLWKKQDLAETYDAVAEEARRAPFPVFWILDAIRHFGAEHALEVARFAASRRDRGVIAFGIGGDEMRGPAEWFGGVFALAKECGLHLVAHAGETGGPESVRAALAIGAERIGHGIAAVRDEALLAELRDRRIPLEICITSNLCTGVVGRLEDHPVGKIARAGVPIVLNTDDPAMFGTTLCREYELAESIFGLDRRELARSSFEWGFLSDGNHCSSKRK